MRRGIVGVLLAVAVCVMIPFGMRVSAETITWTNPTTYTDGSTIPTLKQGQLSTEIQYRIGTGTFTNFGTATGGASTFSAPYITPGGSTSYWRLRSVSVADNNSTSAWSADYPFVRPYQAPAAPLPVSVQ